MGTYQLIRRFPNGATQCIEDTLPYGGQTRGTETSKYPEEEKITNDSVSSGERTRKSPNQFCYGRAGVVGPRGGTKKGSASTWEGTPEKVIVLCT